MKEKTGTVNEQITKQIIDNYQDWQKKEDIRKVVFKTKSTHKIFNYASPTFPYNSHQSWGHKQVCALNGIHQTHPAEVCGTIRFPDENGVLIAKFLSTYAKKIRYETSKTLSLKRSEFYGVLEMRDHDNLIHMHFLARNFQINFLVEHINKFNRKNGRAFDIPYYDMVVDMAAISAYPFKFNKQKKLIFVKGLMRRYVFHCGDYFLSNKRKYEIKGRKQYYGYKLLKDKHAAFTVIRERIHMQIILSKSNS